MSSAARRLVGWKLTAYGLLFSCLYAASAEAQLERRGFIGISLGPSLPFGSIAAASSIEPGTGRTTSGYTDTFLNIGYRYRDRLGIAAAFAYSEYPMQGSDEDWWQVAELAVGPMYTIRLNSRAAVDLKGMVAYFALMPVVDSYETAERTRPGLGVDLRAAARYDVLRRWAVFAEAGMQGSSVLFSTGPKSFGALVLGFGVAFRPAWGS